MEDNELSRFRQQWQNEVSKKKAGRPPSTSSIATPSRYNDDDVELHTYHDLPDLETRLRLGPPGQPKLRPPKPKEPISALDHYEQAIEEEDSGNYESSLRLYREAFKIDDRVLDQYKRNFFGREPRAAPPARAPPTNEPDQPSAVTAKPRRANDSIDSTTTSTSITQPLTIPQLLDEFSQTRILPSEPETDLSDPLPCPIASLPEELVILIVCHLAADDVAHLARVARVCKRLAFLIMVVQRPWMETAQGHTVGFAGMHYDYTCDIKGKELMHSNLVPKPSTQADVTNHLLRTQYAWSWRHMFRTRPRIRFGGCYISTSRYNRKGAATSGSSVWTSMSHSVSYFRYLRFYRDGTCVTLLTPEEPLDVVHHLTMENACRRAHLRTSNLPQRVMKDALRGRWRLSGPSSATKIATATGEPSSNEQESQISSDEQESQIVSDEEEGTLHIETEGVVPKYIWKLELQLGSAGRGTRNNKLDWVHYWHYNKMSDNWGEFALRDAPYFWSRVKSYGV